MFLNEKNFKDAKKPVVLITGFSSFLDFKSNPSELVASLIDQQKPFQDIAIAHTHIFDVDYRKVDLALKDIGARIQPDIVIGFGAMKRDAQIHIETKATNRINTETPDNSGYFPTPEASNSEHRSTLPIESICTALKDENTPHKVSKDAGNYLCNYFLFKVLNEGIGGRYPEFSGFIHLPCLNSVSSSMGKPSSPTSNLEINSNAEIYEAALVIIDKTIEEWILQPQADHHRFMVATS